MDEVTRQNALLVQQATAAAASLEGEAERLAELVSVFRLGAANDGAPPAPARLGAPRAARFG